MKTAHKWIKFCAMFLAVAMVCAFCAPWNISAVAVENGTAAKIESVPTKVLEDTSNLRIADQLEADDVVSYDYVPEYHEEGGAAEDPDFLSDSLTFYSKYLDLFNDYEYEDAETGHWDYYVYDPTEHGYSTDKDYPVSIWFHGAGNQSMGKLCVITSGAAGQADPALQEDIGGMYIIVPVHPGDLWPSADAINAIYQEVRKTCSNTSDELMVAGTSAGGMMVNRWLEAYADITNIVFWMSTSLPEVATVQEYSDMGIRMWYEASAHDGVFISSKAEGEEMLAPYEGIENLDITLFDWMTWGDGNIALLGTEDGGTVAASGGQHCSCVTGVVRNLVLDDGTPDDPNHPGGISGWIRDMLAEIRAESSDNLYEPGAHVVEDADSPSGYTVYFVFDKDAYEAANNVTISKVVLGSDMQYTDAKDGEEKSSANSFSPHEYKNGMYPCNVIFGTDGVFAGYSEEMVKNEATGYYEVSFPITSGAFRYWFDIYDEDGEATSILDPASDALTDNPDSNYPVPAGSEAQNVVVGKWDSVKQSDSPNFDFVMEQQSAENQGKLEFVSYTGAKTESGEYAQQWLGIYTPPGYDESREEPYKVIYLSHGAGGNESSWFLKDRANVIMDNLIAEDATREAIIVTTDTTTIGAGSFADELINYVIPFMEENYNVSTDPEDRAVAGYSMGAMATNMTYAKYPTEFGYFGLFSGNSVGSMQDAYGDLIDVEGLDEPVVAGMSGICDFFFHQPTLEFMEENGLTNYIDYGNLPGSHDCYTWSNSFYLFAKEVCWPTDTTSSSGTPGGSGSVANPSVVVSAAVTPTEADGKASAAVTAEEISGVVADAVSKGADSVVINVKASDSVSEVELTIPSDALEPLVSGTDAVLTVKSPIACVTVKNAGIADVIADSSEIAIAFKASDDGAVNVSIKKDGTELDAVSGGVKIALPNATSENGNVIVLVGADGTETILPKSVVSSDAVAATVNGSATVKISTNDKTYSDTSDHWANDAISFVSSRELFNGMSATEFEPETNMSRAMLATVLHRLESKAAPEGKSLFSDVEDGTWYTDAVNWAYENGIVNGKGNGLFAPNDNITRQELVTMIYRYAKVIGLDTSVTGSIDSYVDSGSVDEWASEAMNWAVSVGIINGISSDAGLTLSPTTTATRAQVATILERVVNLIITGSAD